jgi:hypothetical protein
MEGIDAFRHYKDTKDSAYFYKAETSLHKAIQGNPRYVKAHFYLGTLYNWMALYTDLGSDQENGYRQKSLDEYKKVADGYSAKNCNPEKICESDSLSYFGTGLVHYRLAVKIRRDYFSKSQFNIDDDFSKVDISIRNHIEEALKNFKEAWRKNDTYHFALTGSALSHEEKAYILSIEKKDKKEIADELEKALRKCLKAKKIALKQKDQNSLQWIGNKIHELEFEKRKIKQGERIIPQQFSEENKIQ